MKAQGVHAETREPHFHGARSVRIRGGRYTNCEWRVSRESEQASPHLERWVQILTEDNE